MQKAATGADGVLTWQGEMSLQGSLSIPLC